MNRLIFILSLALLASCDAGSTRAASPDTLLVNGRIYTIDEDWSIVDALALQAGSIIAVGSQDSIVSLANDETKIIDLDGQVVLPGLSDLHVHPVFAGIQAQRCVIPQGADLAGIRANLKSCVAAANPGDWILGGQWDASAIGQAPTRHMIDDISPDNPVYLGDTSEHSALVNSSALEIANISETTPDPQNGIIEREMGGHPSGVLREAARMMVRDHIPEASDSAVIDALRWAVDQMLMHGITSFTEASAGYSTNVLKELSAYAALADSGELKQRVRICMPWQPHRPELDALIDERHTYSRERLNPDCIKIGLDGVPTDGHTAAMLEPYEGTIEGRDDDASRYGLVSIDQEILNAAVTRFDAMEMTVKFHSAGDAAVRAGLDAIGVARSTNGLNKQRHNVGHCTFVAPSDVGRGAELGATFEMSPYLWGPTAIGDDIAKAVGEERVERVWPIREVIDAGSLVVPGSDWSVVPSVNPWIGIETMITRQAPGGGDRSFGKSQAVTLKEAIQLYTVNSAKQMGMEGKLGRIKEGYLADFVVLDRDPFQIPVTQLHQVVVTKTVINGEIVYEKVD